MNPQISELIIGLINRVYIFSIDAVSFVLTLEKTGQESEITNQLRENIGKFSQKVSDLEDIPEKQNIVAGIEKSNTFAAKILENLQKIPCKKELLNEKTDLILRTFKIIEEIDAIREELRIKN